MEYAEYPKPGLRWDRGAWEPLLGNKYNLEYAKFCENGENRLETGFTSR